MNSDRLQEIVGHASRFGHLETKAAPFLRSLFLLKEELGEVAGRNSVQYLTLEESLAYEAGMIRKLVKPLLVHSESIAIADASPSHPLLEDGRCKWTTLSKRIKIGKPNLWMFDDHTDFFLERNKEAKRAVIFVLDPRAFITKIDMGGLCDPLVNGTIERALPRYVLDYVKTVSSQLKMSVVFHRRGIDGCLLFFPVEIAGELVPTILSGATRSINLYNEPPPANGGL